MQGSARASAESASPSKPLRIAMVDPYFAIGLGYQQTGWFNALVAAGHHVRAFCSCYTATVARPLYKQPFPEGLARVNGGEMLRLPIWRLPRDMAYCRGLLKEVLAFDPELTLATYPGTLFAHPLMSHRSKLPGMLATTFAENSAQRRNTHPGWRQTAKNLVLDSGFFVLKRRFYRAAMEASDVVLLQTPSTFDYLLKRVGSREWAERIRSRCLLMPLGYESAVFRFDSQAREVERRRLGISEGEVVALYACKFMPEKRLDVWIRLMSAAMRKVRELRAILVGVREGDSLSDRVAAWVEASGLGSRFICLPFAKREQLARLANAADFGVWHLQPAVTIQEVMGTGLYMVLMDSDTVSHLVIEPETGRYFRDRDYQHAEEVVIRTAQEAIAGSPSAAFEARRRRAESNARRLSYEVLAARLVEAARHPKDALALLGSA